MGSEWERKRAAGFKKQLDKGLVELGTPDLFTQTPSHAPRVVIADILPNVAVQAGQGLVVQKIGDRIALMDGLREIGKLQGSHPDVVRAIDASFGFAKGLIEAFHEDALVAEISLC